ncbi:MAG: tetratricopeptide repeat protein [Acidobacteria bacterium]|nr:tetratricopeptide repeat protein [Acidobacteriota bacterium]
MSERTNGTRRIARAVLVAVFLLLCPHASAQGGHTLFGDVRVDEGKAAELKPLTLDLVLYSETGTILGRQTITNNGRYRFLNLANGRYVIAVEVEGAEVARVPVTLQYAYKTDHREDLNLEWRGGAGGGGVPRAQTVSAADFYKRTTPNKSLFERAQKAIDNKRYEQAHSLLDQLLAADPHDFQAWTELGTVHLMLDDAAEAERAYRRAVEERPAFALALLNLGRLLVAQRRFDAAVEPLTRAVEAQPASAEANYLLGESYLQLKRGSKSVPYFTEAIRLGKTEGHLRLAALYNAAGLKDRAAAEYEQFLAKNPNHPDRKKLEEYVRENKKK